MNGTETRADGTAARLTLTFALVAFRLTALTGTLAALAH